MNIADKLTTIAENEQKVYEAGQKSVYDMLWDTHQINGYRTNYDGAFGGWFPEILRPKYSMYVDNARYMFRKCRGSDIDLVRQLEECGVILNFSNCKDFHCAFNLTSFTRLGKIDISKATHTTYLFAYSRKLETIDEFDVGENSSHSEYGYEFLCCDSLRDITIKGTINRSGWDFSHCKYLTHDSLMSIINALKDYSGTTTTKTLILGATNLAKLTSAEKAIATQKGWTLA